MFGICINFCVGFKTCLPKRTGDHQNCFSKEVANNFPEKWYIIFSYCSENLCGTFIIAITCKQLVEETLAEISSLHELKEYCTKVTRTFAWLSNKRTDT